MRLSFAPLFRGNDLIKEIYLSININFNELRLAQKLVDQGRSDQCLFFETAIFQGSAWPLPLASQLKKSPHSPPKVAIPEIKELLEVEPIPSPSVEIPLDKKKEGALSNDVIQVDIPFPPRSTRCVKIFFVGDTLENGTSMSADNSDMLGRMILAMNFEEGEFIRSTVGQDVFETIAKVRPEIIVALGAKATNLLIGRKEKLTAVHGKLFKNTLQFSSGEKVDISFVPVFHPDYLEINPSMKRSAWADLQKIQEFLEGSNKVLS